MRVSRLRTAFPHRLLSFPHRFPASLALDTSAEGNIMLGDDGRVVFLDFGLMSTVPDDIMDAFALGIQVTDNLAAQTSRAASRNLL